MRRILRFGLILAGVGLLVAIAFFVIGRTTIDISELEQLNNKITVETDFPNTTCQKTLKRDFPFFQLNCKEKPIKTSEPQ